MIRLDTHIHLDCIDDAPPGDPDWRGIVPAGEPGDTPEAMTRFAGDDRVRFATGLHPWYVPTDDAARRLRDALDAIDAVLDQPRVIGMGEIGLDHLRWPEASDRAIVADAFRAQLQLAGRRGRPVILHCVRAHADCLDALHGMPPRPGGIVHAFSGSHDELRRYNRLGVAIGIGSAVTRPNARRVRAAAVSCPDDWLVLETDAPFLATDGNARGAGRASDIDQVARVVAELRGVSVEALHARTAANAARVLGLDPDWLAASASA